MVFQKKKKERKKKKRKEKRKEKKRKEFKKRQAASTPCLEFLYTPVSWSQKRIKTLLPALIKNIFHDPNKLSSMKSTLDSVIKALGLTD